MAPHEEIRLELPEGDPGENVIAYFAPNAETNRSFDNDLTVEGLPGEDSPPLVLDFAQWTAEITLQGEFETTQVGALPQAHVDDLESADMFDKSPVSAHDQFNRLVGMTAFGQQGPYHLYHEGDEYTATTSAQVDVENGIYPAVSIQQIQPALASGETREGYTVRFSIGVES